MKIFETPRLLVRVLTLEDEPSFHEMESNPEVMKYTGSEPKDRETNRKELDDLISRYSEAANNFYIWAITTQKNTFVGTVAFIKNTHEEWEIGYRLLESHWGKGYGTEITKGLLDFVFDNHKAEEVVAYVNKENKASAAILMKFMTLKSEFWNPNENCYDQKFVLTRKKWAQFYTKNYSAGSP